MDVNQILALVKARLGITSAVRDEYLAAIISGVIDELTKEKGIALNLNDAHHLMFIVDYSTWRYQSVMDSSVSYTGQPMSMPRHLQYRLHNLIISAGGGVGGNV